MMSLWDALRMNMMISYQELVRTFPSERTGMQFFFLITNASLNSLFNLADVRIKFSRQQRSWD
ncbi:Uncharacterised protein [Klebsiella pneumoniae]|nr:Uncharacterised protein [Klebsiella pneumoniae]